MYRNECNSNDLILCMWMIFFNSPDKYIKGKKEVINALLSKPGKTKK